MGYRRRLIRTTLVFFKIFLNFRKELALSRRLGYKTTQERMAAAHSKRARELYDIAVESGGVFIKLCQFFSSRRDIFPEPYIKDEVDDRIAELKSLFLTTSCTLCSVLCFGTGYTLYSVGLFNPAYLVAAIGTVSLLLGFDANQESVSSTNVN